MKKEMIDARHPRAREIMELQAAKRAERKAISKNKIPFAYPKLNANEYQHLNKYIHDGMWSNRRCFIIGGGPSLKGFDFKKLEGELTIGINRAYEKFEPSIIFGADRRFFEWAAAGEYGPEALEKWKKAKAPKIRLYTEGNGDATGIDDVIPVQCFANFGLTRSLQEGLNYGGNSGYAALNLAILLGANPIYLLGFDMHLSGGWWHDGHPGGKQGDITGFINEFKRNKNEILQRARVINLNRYSNLKCFPFGDFPPKQEKIIEKPKTYLESKQERIIKRIKHNKKWILISYYTIDTPYEHEVENLKRTISRKKIDYCIFGKSPLGSWRKNLDHKSAIILHALKMFPGKDIVFVDSDAQINKYPELFDRLSKEKTSDIAACFHEYRESVFSGSLLSGTLWIGNNKMGHDIVVRWHEIGLLNPNIRHQHCLRLAIDEFNLTGKLLFVYRLPDSYTYIFDYNYKKKVDPVITHYQASRRFRKDVGESIMLRDSNFTAATGNYKKC